MGPSSKCTLAVNSEFGNSGVARLIQVPKETILPLPALFSSSQDTFLCSINKASKPATLRIRLSWGKRNFDYRSEIPGGGSRFFSLAMVLDGIDDFSKQAEVRSYLYLTPDAEGIFCQIARRQGDELVWLG